ncbi:hypothetical protein PCURB6_13650 [Paenibacillus curdlanolyticus]|nr:hypothetical protein PCURB6_13650 [Paenibacillus curdlanolyticus]
MSAGSLTSLYWSTSIPEQCGVTGFDNTSPDLTTVNVNKELLGMRAVDKLLWRCVPILEC